MMPSLTHGFGRLPYTLALKAELNLLILLIVMVLPLFSLVCMFNYCDSVSQNFGIPFFVTVLLVTRLG